MKLKQHKYMNLLIKLQCPNCHKGRIRVESNNLLCDYCNSEFPIKKNRPVLLNKNNKLFKKDDYLQDIPLQENQKFNWKFLLPSPSLNLASTRVLNKLTMLLDTFDCANVLVVGGGKQRIWLDSVLTKYKSHQIIYSDIDVSADVDLFCDGHDLPFMDNIFDAVITTAVLEHVMYPERVASEITRVLKLDGFLYSELPFMQQVHEGAYDFTRYTLSGHRRLFNRFKELDSGLVAGPGTALAWAIENFLLAFSSRKKIRSILKILSRLIFSWFKYFDYLLAKRPEAVDGASCTYFLGKKAELPVADEDIINRYVGAKYLRHT